METFRAIVTELDGSVTDIFEQHSPREDLFIRRVKRMLARSGRRGARVTIIFTRVGASEPLRVIRWTIPAEYRS